MSTEEAKQPLLAGDELTSADSAHAQSRATSGPAGTAVTGPGIAMPDGSVLPALPLPGLSQQGQANLHAEPRSVRDFAYQPLGQGIAMPDGSVLPVPDPAPEEPYPNVQYPPPPHVPGIALPDGSVLPIEPAHHNPRQEDREERSQAEGSSDGEERAPEKPTPSQAPENRRRLTDPSQSREGQQDRPTGMYARPANFQPWPQPHYGYNQQNLLPAYNHAQHHGMPPPYDNPPLYPGASHYAPSHQHQYQSFHHQQYQPYNPLPVGYAGYQNQPQGPHAPYVVYQEQRPAPQLQNQQAVTQQPSISDGAVHTTFSFNSKTLHYNQYFIALTFLILSFVCLNPWVLPCAIPALCFAYKAAKANAENSYDEALKYHRKAKHCNIATGVISIVLFIVILVVLIALYFFVESAETEM